MILATRSSAKTFSFVGKQAGASIPTCSTENGGAKFWKKEWQRIGDEIKVAMIFAWADFVNVHSIHFVCRDDLRVKMAEMSRKNSAKNFRFENCFAVLKSGCR